MRGRSIPAAGDYFFYGTLLDAEVRRIVIGRGAERIELVPARLAGYRRIAKRRASVPTLRRAAGAMVEGLLARALDRRQAARIHHYEGRHYRIERHPLRLADGTSVSAAVYFAGSGAVRRFKPWRLADWQRRFKRPYLKQARLWLAAFRPAGYETRSRLRPVVRWAARD